MVLEEIGQAFNEVESIAAVQPARGARRERRWEF